MTLHGWTAPGFEGVRDVFSKHFADGLEIGAAFAAYQHGRPVVDLWGGIADPATERPWVEDTIELVFSTTKGATAICANQLVQEGRLDVDAPVTEYWPEFAPAGKDTIPVRYLLSHRAGLAWVDETLTLEQALAWEPLIHALEHQQPIWPPGSAHGYHAVTYGHLVGEVVRRVTGRSIGTYFRDEIAAPLGLDFWIGLPEEHEPRVAHLVGDLLDFDNPSFDEATRTEMLRLVGPDSWTGKALSCGGPFGGAGIWNTRAVHAAEVPAANGVGDARSIARLYAACIGEVDGIRLLTAEQLRAATTQETEGPDIVLLDLDLQFGLGFGVRGGIVTLGGPGSFGHFGAGGSVGWADPEADLAFGYVMNRMDLGLAGDQRCYGLINACFDALT